MGNVAQASQQASRTRWANGVLTLIAQSDWKTVISRIAGQGLTGCRLDQWRLGIAGTKRAVHALAIVVHLNLLTRYVVHLGCKRKQPLTLLEIVVLGLPRLPVVVLGTEPLFDGIK